ncbi:hypothetical protein CF319_g5130 [Tilletia indica]|uniref:Uncharacterized protein n=1 Tax=Tilletia indica TaxID=43049 RepID=A0A177TSU4_9BASI|nr:hypothetical protein CF326_g10111 [Tilletia indica]KAE8221522.1 hypothetical protein CF319_g5130 [Tilletia indica]KAE8249271.1 hypothetical protein A4X13_0g5274 [Tilletia indica]
MDHSFLVRLLLSQDPRESDFSRVPAMLRKQAEGCTDPDDRRRAPHYCDEFEGPGGAEKLILEASRYVNFTVRLVPHKASPTGNGRRKTRYFQMFLITPLFPYFSVAQPGCIWTPQNGMTVAPTPHVE